MPIAKRIPAVAIRTAIASRFGHPMTSEIAIAINGVMSGAINMAPMTMAVESVSTPMAAMIEAKVIKVKKRVIRRG